MANFILLDDQQVTASLVVEDDQGNSVTLPTGLVPTWTSSDATVLTVDSSADPTGLTAVIKTTGKLGTGVQVAVSAALTVGGTPLTGTILIDVTASAASQIAVNLGTPSARV